MVVDAVGQFLEGCVHQVPAANFTRLVVLVGNLEYVCGGLVEGDDALALHPALRGAAPYLGTMVRWRAVEEVGGWWVRLPGSHVW